MEGRVMTKLEMIKKEAEEKALFEHYYEQEKARLRDVCMWEHEDLRRRLKEDEQSTRSEKNE